MPNDCNFCPLVEIGCKYHVTTLTKVVHLPSLRFPSSCEIIIHFFTLELNICIFVDPGAEVERKIRKARAEEFIHIFVHQKAHLIEFLEHMVQVFILLMLSDFCTN